MNKLNCLPFTFNYLPRNKCKCSEITILYLILYVLNLILYYYIKVRCIYLLIEKTFLIVENNLIFD